jgi:Sister chromatid cohesion C-terminus
MTCDSGLTNFLIAGKAHAESENLKEMGDVSSGTASHVIQIYLKDILNCFLNADAGVRFWAMKVIEVVLRQGLVPPVQIVPYLILLSTDPEKEVMARILVEDLKSGVLKALLS